LFRSPKTGLDKHLDGDALASTVISRFESTAPVVNQWRQRQVSLSKDVLMLLYSLFYGNAILRHKCVEAFAWSRTTVCSSQSLQFRTI
jgi:hypothetical protein